MMRIEVGPLLWEARIMWFDGGTVAYTQPRKGTVLLGTEDVTMPPEHTATCIRWFRRTKADGPLHVVDEYWRPYLNRERRLYVGLHDFATVAGARAYLNRTKDRHPLSHEHYSAALERLET